MTSVTIYLTKTEEGKLHHFRATVAENGVEIAQGVVYHWMGKISRDAPTDHPLWPARNNWWRKN